MNLSLRQLSVFREVMLSGSISQAAKTVGRTQPAVSTMIAKLEDELGFVLFRREHGKLIPTPEAQYFLEEAEAVLARLERTKQALVRIGALETGKLRIACYPAASGLFLPRLLTRFLADKREVDLSLIMRSSTLIEDMLASQQFDLGFAETPAPRPSIAQTDFDLECVCVLRADDPLAAQAVIGPADLDGRPMAVLFDDHPIAMQTELAFVRQGCRFEKRIELRTFLTGLPFVAEGLCYMVCDMITAYSHIPGQPEAGALTVRRFVPRISSRISILTPAYASQSLLAKAFARDLAEAVRAMQEEMQIRLAAGR